MKVSKLLLLVLIMFNVWLLKSQSFEIVTIFGLTTTPSDSRSANFIDINNDGWDDIFITNSGNSFSPENNFLYLNNTDGTFTIVKNDDIVQDNSRSVGASFADADNDGDIDAFMVTWGVNTKNYFYRNNGNGTFTYEATNVSGSLSTFSEMTTWIDANNDQNLDIYFTNSAESANSYYQNLNNGLFESNANLAFTNEFFSTRSVDLIDYDNDGKLDLFLTNEDHVKNSLFKYNSPNNYTKITNITIVQDSKNSAGSSWADIDNDGDFDLFIANYSGQGQKNQLFRNDGGAFTEVTTSNVSVLISNSFGSTFGDLDNDGDLDLIVCNSYSNLVNKNYIYMNDGKGNFTQDTTSNLANFSGWTYSSALGDYNNDGWLDVIFANNQNSNQTNTLFRNTGKGNNWVKFNFEGITSNKSAIGTKIRIKSKINGIDTWQTRRISSNSGYCSQNSYTVHFGLSNATLIDKLEITWPIGQVEVFNNVEINKIHNIVEGKGLALINSNIDQIKVISNPVKGILNLYNLPNEEFPKAILKIVDLNGKEVAKFYSLDKDNKFDVSILKSGIYYSIISTAKNKIIFRKKIIINN